MRRKALPAETRDRIVELLDENVPGALQEWREAHGELTLIVDAEKIREVCRFMRDEPGLRFDYLSDLTAVDNLG